MADNPYTALKIEDDAPPATIPAEGHAEPSSVAPATDNPYTQLKYQLETGEQLTQNPTVRDHLANFFKFTGHGVNLGLVEDLGLPVDTINLTNEFIKNFPAVGHAAMHLPLIGPFVQAAQIVQRAKGDDTPIETGSGEFFKKKAKDIGLPISTPQEEGVTDPWAGLGRNIGEFTGANLPFAAGGIAKETAEIARAVTTSLAKKAWELFKPTLKHAILPATSIGTLAEAGEYVGGEKGRVTGATLGALRYQGIKAAFGGIRSANDWLRGLITTQPRVARNLVEAASDIPGGVARMEGEEKSELAYPLKSVMGSKTPKTLEKNLEKARVPGRRTAQPQMSPGSEFPTDIKMEDPGLMALTRSVRDKDRELAGLYDEQWKTTDEAIKADAKYSKANYANAAEYLQAKNAQWEQLIHRRVQQADEEAERAFNTATGDAIPNAVDAEKFKGLQATLTRQYLMEARDDMRAVTETKWDNVDKTVPVATEPLYDELAAMKKEHAERPGESDARFPSNVLERFFDKIKVPDEGGEEIEQVVPKFQQAKLQDVIDLDSEIGLEIRQVSSELAPDRVRLAYLTRISKALRKVKENAPGGVELREANAATKVFHQTFDQGPVGRILGHDEPGYPRVEPGNTIRSVISQGPGGVDSFGAFMRAVAQKAGTTSPPEYLENYLRQDFYDAAMPNGTFNMSGATKWLNNNKGPLAHPGFAKLKQDVENAIKTQGEAVTAGKVRKWDIDKLRKHAAATFLAEPGKLFSGALHSTQQYKKFKDLTALTDADTTGRATEGLIQMSFDRMIKDSIEIDRSTPELQRLHGDKVAKWVEENAGLIKALDEARPGVASRFKRIAQTARKNELHHVSPDIPGISEKAQNMMLRDIVARVMGAKVATHVLGGHGGSSIQIASIGSQAFKQWAKSLSPDDGAKVLARAMVDPQFFKLLVTDISEDMAAAHAKLMEPYLLSMQVPLIQSQVPKQPDPASLGAKQAPDGKFYIPDTERPGKYLQVDHAP